MGSFSRFSLEKVILVKISPFYFKRLFKEDVSAEYRCGWRSSADLLPSYNALAIQATIQRGSAVTLILQAFKLFYVVAYFLECYMLFSFFSSPPS